MERARACASERARWRERCRDRNSGTQRQGDPHAARARAPAGETDARDPEAWRARSRELQELGRDSEELPGRALGPRGAWGGCLQRHCPARRRPPSASG